MSSTSALGSANYLSYKNGQLRRNRRQHLLLRQHRTNHPYQPACGADAEGDTTQITYDGPGNTTKVADTTASGTGVSTTATYNPPAGTAAVCGGLPGQVCTQTNGLGGVTHYAYDTAGDLTTTTPPAPLAASTATYDTLGRATTSTDGKGQKTSYTYDKANRTTQVLTAGATTCNYGAGTCVTNTYDADGNLTASSDVTGTTTYAYDLLGRETSRSLPQKEVAIGVGQSAAQGIYAADTGYSGTTNTASTTTQVDTSGLTNPAPQAVYQTERWGNTFSYTISGLTPSASYQVRLHFAEFVWSGPGQRVFSVTVNGAAFLTNFDIYAAAGNQYKAVIRAATTTANSSGQIVLAFTSSTDNAKIDGIEAVPTTAAATPALALTYDAAGNVLTYTDAGGTVTYTYDTANELTDLAEPGGTCAISGGGYCTTTNQAPTANYCTTFAYNNNGARTTTLYPGGAKRSRHPR